MHRDLPYRRCPGGGCIEADPDVNTRQGLPSPAPRAQRLHLGGHHARSNRSLAAFGLDRIGQVDLGSRAHRNRDLTSLSMMAFSIVQVVMRRLGQRARAPLDDLMNTTMKLVCVQDGLSLEVREMRERERPPIATIAAYRQRRALITAARTAARAR